MSNYSDYSNFFQHAYRPTVFNVTAAAAPAAKQTSKDDWLVWLDQQMAAENLDSVDARDANDKEIVTKGREMFQEDEFENARTTVTASTPFSVKDITLKHPHLQEAVAAGELVGIRNMGDLFQNVKAHHKAKVDANQGALAKGASNAVAEAIAGLTADTNPLLIPALNGSNSHENLKVLQKLAEDIVGSNGVIERLQTQIDKFGKAMEAYANTPEGNTPEGIRNSLKWEAQMTELMGRCTGEFLTKLGTLLKETCKSYERNKNSEALSELMNTVYILTAGVGAIGNLGAGISKVVTERPKVFTGKEKKESTGTSTDGISSKDSGKAKNGDEAKDAEGVDVEALKNAKEVHNGLSKASSYSSALNNAVTSSIALKNQLLMNQKNESAEPFHFDKNAITDEFAKSGASSDFTQNFNGFLGDLESAFQQLEKAQEDAEIEEAFNRSNGGS
jgi:hypothetical protein